MGQDSRKRVSVYRREGQKDEGKNTWEKKRGVRKEREEGNKDGEGEMDNKGG